MHSDLGVGRTVVKIRKRTNTVRDPTVVTKRVITERSEWCLPVVEVGGYSGRQKYRTGWVVLTIRSIIAVEVDKRSRALDVRSYSCVHGPGRP